MPPSDAEADNAETAGEATTSTLSDAEVNKSIVATILGRLFEATDVDKTTVKTEFVERLALELHANTRGNGKRGELEKGDLQVDAILKALVTNGITIEQEFKQIGAVDGFDAFRTGLDRIGGLNFSQRNLLASLWSTLLDDDLGVLVKDKLDKVGNIRRESLERENENAKLPNERTVKAEQQPKLGVCMKFVNRESSINVLLKHSALQYHRYLIGTKNEQKLQWAACSGGPGLGKTTFCRKAFTKAVGKGVDINDPTGMWDGVPTDNNFYERVKECVESGRQYRLPFSHPLICDRDLDNPSMSLAWRLALVVTGGRDMSFPKRSDGPQQLESVLNAIFKFKRESFIVINFDETNKLLDNDGDTRGKGYMETMLGAIREYNAKQKGFVFCIFSGTNVRPLHNLLMASSGGTAPREMPLPLLGEKHVRQVLGDLLVRASGDKDIMISPKNDRLLTFVLTVLGGVPRYIEILVYILGTLAQAAEDGLRRFSWSSFVQALTTDESDYNLGSNAHYVLESVKTNISVRYAPEHASILSSIPCKAVVCFSLFEWHVTRNTVIRKGKPNESDITVETLERYGVVFLQNVNGEDSPVLPVKLVFPLVLLLETVHDGKNPPALLMDFRLMLSCEENERKTLQIFALKAEALQAIHGNVQVGKLLPLTDSTAKYGSAVMAFGSFTILEATHQIVRGEGWKKFYDEHKEHGVLCVNAKGAPFSDMVMIGKEKGSDICLYFQEKQVELSKTQLHGNKKAPTAKASEVLAEHEKCRNDTNNYLFVMITDKVAEQTELAQLAENELLITHDTQQLEIGSLLALLRFFNQEQRNRELPKRKKTHR